MASTSTTTLESLFGNCVICEKLGWAQDHSGVCQHMRFEASRRVDYQEHMKQIEMKRYDSKIEALNKRTPEEKAKDDAIIAEQRAAMQLLTSVYCTCNIDAPRCTCNYGERYAAMPFNAYLKRCGL